MLRDVRNIVQIDIIVSVFTFCLLSLCIMLHRFFIFKLYQFVGFCVVLSIEMKLIHYDDKKYCTLH